MHGKIIHIRDYYIINHNEIMYYPDELYENLILLMPNYGNIISNNN